MLDKLSYKIRVQIGLGVFVLLLVLGYHLSFRKTIDAYNDYERYKNIETESPTNLNFGAVKKRFDVLDSSYNAVQNSDYDRILINELSRLVIDHNVKLVSMKHVKVTDVLIDELVATGSFNHLVALVYDLEKGFYAGSILSTNFETVKNKKTKKIELILTLYLQRNDAHIKK